MQVEIVKVLWWAGKREEEKEEEDRMGCRLLTGTLKNITIGMEKKEGKCKVKDCLPCHLLHMDSLLLKHHMDRS